MDKISSKINLAALKNATILKMGKTQIECLIIPIAQNNLFIGKEVEGKGRAVYLDTIGFPLANPKADSKDTHLVKQSLPKDVREKMTEEEQKAMPILGNFSVWGAGGTAEPTGAAAAATEDDLPF